MYVYRLIVQREERGERLEIYTENLRVCWFHPVPHLPPDMEHYSPFRGFYYSRCFLDNFHVWGNSRISWWGLLLSLGSVEWDCVELASFFEGGKACSYYVIRFHPSRRFSRHLSRFTPAGLCIPVSSQLTTEGIWVPKSQAKFYTFILHFHRSRSTILAKLCTYIGYTRQRVQGCYCIVTTVHDSYAGILGIQQAYFYDI